MMGSRRCARAHTHLRGIYRGRMLHLGQTASAAGHRSLCILICSNVLLSYQHVEMIELHSELEARESGMKNKVPRHGSASRGTNSSEKQPLLVHTENLPDYARQRNKLFQYELTAGCWLIL